MSGILVKCALRNDGYALFKKEDVAVGPQLMLTAALTYVVLTTERARSIVELNSELKSELEGGAVSPARLLEIQSMSRTMLDPLMTAPWVLLGISVLLFATTIIVKRWGWESESLMTPRIGIAIPLIMGVSTLVYVMLMVDK